MLKLFLFRLDAKWEVSSDSEDVWTDVGKTNTGYLQPNLVIKPNELKEEANYTFNLEIGFLGSVSKSLYKMTVKTSSTPTGGTCDVT